MKIQNFKFLLADKRVIEEINKHLWIESQKAGFSIGLEKATEDWITQHANEWVKYNMPEKYPLFKAKPKAKKA